MWFSWFQDNAWVATWLMLTGFSVTESILVYYIVTFLGSTDRQERKQIAKKLKSLGTPTASDRARESIK
jgi:hypothetical protein